MAKSIINLLTAFIPMRVWRRSIRRKMTWWWYGLPVRHHAKSVGRDFQPGGLVHVDGKVEIGDDVGINGLRKEGRGRLIVGSHVRMGRDILVLSENHDYADADRLPYGNGFVPKDVIIGDCVWIGHRVTILPGTEIGEGVVVQAGSVVHGRVPPLSIVGGNPAKPFASRDPAHYARVRKTMDDNSDAV